jgi:hypothetical protein
MHCGSPLARVCGRRGHVQSCPSGPVLPLSLGEAQKVGALSLGWITLNCPVNSFTEPIPDGERGGGNPLTTHSPDWNFPLITDCIFAIQGVEMHATHVT